MRKIVTVLFIITAVALAGVPIVRDDSRLITEPSLGEVTNTPAGGWIIWWTGIGNVSDFVIANAMQGGVFPRHADDEHLYDGLPPTSSIEQYPDISGRNAEYPADSKQFYLWAMGFWFSAMYDSAGTVIPNVSKAAYYSDMGAMSVPEMENAGSMGDISSIGLFISDMRIPVGYGYQGEGNSLFKQHGKTQESYQALWPFADTILNGKRSGDKLDPSQGDMVSHEDSYAVGGDWIPVDEAATIWLPSIEEITPYDRHGLGIRVEQRTYSWDHGALGNVVVVNLKIRNMNDFTLESPYFSYFMDPDIGEGGSGPGQNGSWDDKIGFDQTADLGYAYDNNGSETGWSTPPGYIGAVLLETPGNIGLTGFETWENGDTIDSYSTDSFKYDAMKSTEFKTSDTPTDVRMLLNSGPYPDLAAGAEFDFTVAVVVGDDLADLKEKVDSVRAAYNAGFPWYDPTAVSEKPETPRPLELRLTNSNITSGLVTLSYSLPSLSRFELTVYDASGRRVQTLREGYASGLASFAWDASGVPAGVYFVRLATPERSVSQRVVIIR